jgi:hypothetical protein
VIVSTHGVVNAPTADSVTQWIACLAILRRRRRWGTQRQHADGGVGTRPALTAGIPVETRSLNSA